MEKGAVQSKIETLFRQQVQNDKKARNAYLLVHSNKLNINLSIAEGKTGNINANTQQPIYMASVGKLFTATIICMLHEKGELAFNDKISNYLDADLLDKLHVYKGKDYSHEITVRQLLKQTSGLYDSFWPLLKKLLKDTDLQMTPREAVIWGKENLKPKSKPGRKHYYTDTNYYLLGFIIESITKKPFHEVLHQYIFEPLGMTNSYMQGYSEPAIKPEHPVAGYYINDTDGSTLENFPGIDYTGGGVVATLADYLKFMKALVNKKLINNETLQLMLSDDVKKYPTIRYGYAIWKFITIPVLMPEKYNCWGCVGATGAFMFFHPKTESYIIGSFNDVSYRSKALRFMLTKVIKQLLKGDN